MKQSDTAIFLVKEAFFRARAPQCRGNFINPQKPWGLMKFTEAAAAWFGVSQLTEEK